LYIIKITGDFVKVVRILLFFSLLWLFFISYGYTKDKSETSLEADKVFVEEDGWIVAEGNVKITYKGTVIEADQAEVNKHERIVRAFGHVYLNEQGDQAQGELLTYNLRKKEGIIFRGKGKTKNFRLKGNNVNDYIYFRGEEASTKPGNFLLDMGDFTTCDRDHPHEHYNMTAKSIDVEPGEKLVAKNVSVYYKGYKIFWLPIMIISLKERERQQFLPQMGYNQFEGFFIKQLINYYINTNHYGSTNISYASKLGVSWGATHNYRVGQTGQGSFSYLRQSSQNIVNNQFSFRHAQNLSDRLTMNYTFNVSKSTGTRLVTNPNINSTINLNYRGDQFNTSFSTRYFKGSSLNQNISFSLTHNHTFFQKFTTNLQVNSVNDSGPNTNDRNQLKLLLTGRSPMGPLNMDFTVDYAGANFIQYYTQKLPNVNFAYVNPIMIGDINIPITTSFGFGYFDEQSSKTKMYRGYLKLNYNRNFTLGEGNNLNISSYLDQTFYGSGEARYILNTNINLSNSFANHYRSQLNFTSNIPDGYSPFSFDGIGSRYHAITYQMELYDESKWRFTLNTGYNITDESFQTLITRFDFRPRNNLIFNFGFAYDLNNHQAQNFDTHLDLQVHPEWRFEYASSYNFVSNSFGNQDFKITKDCHCWLWSLAYRTYRDEFLLQVAIKAFPYETFQIGASPEGPILPILQDIQNQISNPNFQF